MNTPSIAQSASGLKRIQLRTPAKINLFLQIVGRRADGYHLLESVFRAVNLYDQLELSVRADGAITRSVGPAEIAPENDLCIRAATLLQRHSGCSSGADIQLYKRIPTGAGLGGGSSDAAGVLIALNRLWQLHYDNASLRALALQLGADVPFFIEAGDQFATGVGEQLEPIVLPPAHYVIVHPGVHCPTPLLFAQADLKRDYASIRPQQFLQGTATENAFEPVAIRLYPEIGAAKQWLMNQAGNARLTGSGSALFAQTRDHRHALAIQKACPAPWRAWFARSLGAAEGA